MELDQPTGDYSQSTEPATPPHMHGPSLVGQTVGRYRVTSIIGQGGMGVVYEAQQEHPKRLVALKVINPGITSRSALRRFEHEAQILGLLQHSGIAQIYEAGTFDLGAGEQPYFAMEYVRGEPLTQYAERSRLSTHARLELMVKICHAVQHAHQKGVIHRDLKPGNILVTEDGEPKVLDFGVARATDSDIQTTTIQTNVGQLIGTVPYMSPEQAGGDPNELDTRSDVYALGVVAYELLAERLPYALQEKMIHEVLRIIREDEPTRLSSINRTLRGDVEIVIGKALAKEKDRRYQSALDFAADIERCLRDEPIVARPPSAAYQFRKFTRRHKALVGGVVATTFMLASGLVTALVLLKRANDAYAAAEAASIAEHIRSEELARTVTFHQSLLLQIDPHIVGAQWFGDLRSMLHESLQRLTMSDDEIEARLASLHTIEEDVNPTDLTRQILDRNLLQPALQTLDREFDQQPVVSAMLRQSVAQVYAHLSMYSDAIEHQGRGVEVLREHLPSSDVRVLEADTRYGLMLNRVERFEDAMEYLSTAHDRAASEFGESHGLTLQAKSALAEVHLSQGRGREAADLMHEILKATERTAGHDHPDTIMALNNVAVAYAAIGRHDEAIEVLYDALARAKSQFGELHSETLKVILNIGGALLEMGRLDDAEEYLRRAHDGRRRVLGDEHIDTLRAATMLGAAHTHLGNLDKAESLLEPAYVSLVRITGPRHPITTETRFTLFNLRTQQGRDTQDLAAHSDETAPPHLEPDEIRGKISALVQQAYRHAGADDWEAAEAVTRQAIELQGQLTGAMSVDVVSLAAGAARVAMNAGRYEQGASLLGLALDRGREGGLPPVQVARIAHDLGMALGATGRYAEATEHLHAAWETSRTLSGPNNLTSLVFQRSYGLSLINSGARDEGYELLMDCMDRCTRTLGPGHDQSIMMALTMASVELDRNNLEQAAAHIEHVRSLPERPRRDRHSIQADLLHARLLRTGGNLDDASAILRAALDKQLTQSHPDLRQFTHTLVALVNVKREQRKFHEAESLLSANWERFAPLAHDLRLQRRVSECFADLYDAWHAAEPGAGHDVKAAEWRAKLPAEAAEDGAADDADNE